jgi:hypothetical protein
VEAVITSSARCRFTDSAIRKTEILQSRTPKWGPEPHGKREARWRGRGPDQKHSEAHETTVRISKEYFLVGVNTCKFYLSHISIDGAIWRFRVSSPTVEQLDPPASSLLHFASVCAAICCVSGILIPLLCVVSGAVFFCCGTPVGGDSLGGGSHSTTHWKLLTRL